MLPGQKLCLSKRCSIIGCLVVVLLAVACEHVSGAALRRSADDEMVPVGQALGDSSIAETVHQTGDLKPELAEASSMISPAEEEEAEEGDEAGEIQQSTPTITDSQVQLRPPVNDAGMSVTRGAPAHSADFQTFASSPQSLVDQHIPEVLPQLASFPPANFGPAVQAAAVSDDTAPHAVQDSAADTALPVVEENTINAEAALPVVDSSIVENTDSSVEPVVATTTPASQDTPRLTAPHASGTDARADLSLASRRQHAGLGHTRQADEPEESRAEVSDGEGEGEEDGGGSPSNASQIVLDPNVKEYTICDPPCIAGRGICNDNVCFCKTIYYGSTCQHQIREDEWLQLAPPVVGVLCIVAAGAGIALAQILFNGIQTGRKAFQELSFGPPTVRKECWQPSDSSASKKGKK